MTDAEELVNTQQVFSAVSKSIYYVVATSLVYGCYVSVNCMSAKLIRAYAEVIETGYRTGCKPGFPIQNNSTARFILRGDDAIAAQNASQGTRILLYTKSGRPLHIVCLPTSI